MQESKNTFGFRVALIGFCVVLRVFVARAEAPAVSARIVPVWPLLSAVDADDARMTFYYNGALQDPEKCEFAVSVDKGALCRARLSGARKGNVRLGRIHEGRHTICVGVRAVGASSFVHTNCYTITAVRPVKGPAGRRLNNFVTELAQERRGDSVRFFNPRDGWVYLEPRPGAANGRMHYMRAGWQTLRAVGPEQPVIRAVPRLVAVEPWLYGNSDLDKWHWGRGFTLRYVLPYCNTAAFYNVSKAAGGGDGKYGQGHDELRSHGISIEGIVGMAHNDPVRNRVEDIKNRLGGSVTAREGFDLIVDENGIACGDRPGKINYAEALWPLADGQTAVNTFFCDARESFFEDLEAEIPIISSIVNSGRGRGMLYLEVYPSALADGRAAHQLENHFADFRRRTLELVPAAERNILYFFGTFLEHGNWSDWSQPEADIRVLYNDFVRRIATDPAYGDPGGLAAGYFNHTDDDVARWFAKVVRHYAVEGRTDDLAVAAGLRYLPGHVRNPDFAQGLDGWKVECAEPGSLTPYRIEGYGRKKGQGRQKVPDGTGDSVARFIRSGKAANRLSQTLTGLTPGRHYAVMFITADEEDVMAPLSVPEPKPLSAEIERGGTVVPALGYVHQSPRDRPWEVRVKHEKNPMKLICRIVFKATATEADLVFSDWQGAASPDASDRGRKNLLNFVNVRRYFTEGEDEWDFLQTLKQK